MFIWLMVVTLAVSAAVCFFATRFFDKPIGSILTRIVSKELAFAWHRYITFAIYVVGISGAAASGRWKDTFPPILRAKPPSN